MAFQLVPLWQEGESSSLPEKQLKPNESGGRSSYLSRVPVFARQQRSAQLGAVGEIGLAGLDLGADPLVVLLQQLHRGDVPGSKGGGKGPDGVVRASILKGNAGSGMIGEKSNILNLIASIF